MQRAQDGLTLEQAEQGALVAAKEIAARFENDDPSALSHLFSECLAIFLKNFDILPPSGPTRVNPELRNLQMAGGVF